MSDTNRVHWRQELRGGIEATLQGVATLVMPSLLFVGILGPLAGAPGLWSTLLAITLIPVLRLLLGGSSVVLSAPRTASTATFVALVLHLGLAASNSPLGAGTAVFNENQLRLGLAAAGLMYLLASLLVALSGLFRLGRVFKMIPTPVSTGISNGTALLLLVLAVGQVQHGGWLAAAAALAMVLGARAWTLWQRRSAWARPLPSIVIAFGIGLAAVWSSPALPPPSAAAPELGLQWTALALWPQLAEVQLGPLLMLGIPGAITLALVMVLETFTASSAMEIRFGLRIPPDRELIALGGANIVGALVGGVPCAGSPVYSIACWQGNGRSWRAAAMCFAVSGLALVLCQSWVLALPAGLAAGLLVLQAELLVSPVFVQSLREVLRSGRWRRPRGEDLGFWIALLITLVGFFGNLIWACFAGVGLSCLAVLRRLSANLLAQWTYLDTLRSRRIRSVAEADALAHLAHHVGVLRLTGHLFFGNSARITQLADELHGHSLCAVVDISLVQDADPSGLDAVVWLLRTLRERRVQVVLTGLAKTRVGTLRSSLEHLPELVHSVDLDRGLEWCEDWVLQHATALPRLQDRLAVEHNSLLHGLSPAEVQAVLRLATPRQVAQGEALFRKDEVSDGVWLLLSGRVSILAGSGPLATRLATFGPGQFVGEMGFIDGNTRSATASADAAVQALLLDRQAIAALVRDYPQAALGITRNIARELAHRVRSTSAVLAQEIDSPHSSWGNSTLGLNGK